MNVQKKMGHRFSRQHKQGVELVYTVPTTSAPSCQLEIKSGPELPRKEKAGLYKKIIIIIIYIFPTRALMMVEIQPHIEDRIGYRLFEVPTHRGTRK